MALPILDGNQTATTLSSVVTGGEHIVAHSVVSLGPTAISNIASAVSGIPISGTVTANVSAVGNAGETIPDGALVIGLEVGGTLERVSNNVPLPVTAVGAVTIGSLPAISGTVTVSNVAGFNIPTHDFKSFAYTSGNLTQIAYRTGGASGTTVGILTLAYDGSGNLTSMTKT